MNQKPHISPFTWFFMGLAAGLVVMFFYQLGVRQKFAEGYYDDAYEHTLHYRAMEAYASENKPVAIYAASQYLALLEKFEGTKNPLMSGEEMSTKMMEAHGWLAKLYIESGDTNLGTEHMKSALGFAQTTGRFSWVTNQATLWSFIDKRHQ